MAPVADLLSVADDPDPRVRPPSTTGAPGFRPDLNYVHRPSPDGSSPIPLSPVLRASGRRSEGHVGPSSLGGQPRTLNSSRAPSLVRLTPLGTLGSSARVAAPQPLRRRPGSPLPVLSETCHLVSGLSRRDHWPLSVQVGGSPLVLLPTPTPEVRPLPPVPEVSGQAYPTPSPSPSQTVRRHRRLQEGPDVPRPDSPSSPRTTLHRGRGVWACLVGSWGQGPRRPSPR